MTLASARLKASMWFPPLRGTCKGCDTEVDDGGVRGDDDGNEGNDNGEDSPDIAQLQVELEALVVHEMSKEIGGKDSIVLEA